MPRRHDAVRHELTVGGRTEVAVDANARAHHRILELLEPRRQVGEMLFAHFAVGIGVGADAGIMAREPSARRAMTRFAADAVLGGNGARGARGAVAAETHLRLGGIADAEIARDELAAIVIEDRPGAAVRTAGGRGLLPLHQLVLADDCAVAFHPAVAGRPRARSDAGVARAAFALRPRGRRKGERRNGEREQHRRQNAKCRGTTGGKCRARGTTGGKCRPRPIAALLPSVRRHPQYPFFPIRRLLRSGSIYTTPKASIASATFLNPAILAPFT